MTASHLPAVAWGKSKSRRAAGKVISYGDTRTPSAATAAEPMGG